MLVGEAVVVGRAGVAAQGFPEAREPGWSGLSLWSCSSYTGHSREVLGGAHGQLAHYAFGRDWRSLGGLKGGRRSTWGLGARLALHWR